MIYKAGSSNLFKFASHNIGDHINFGIYGKYGFPGKWPHETETDISDNEWCPAWGMSSGTWDTNFGNGYFATTAVTSAVADGNGEGQFEYAPPSGYLALCTNNLGSDS